MPNPTEFVVRHEIDTDPRTGFDHLDASYAKVLESTDEVEVEYTAEPNDDGSKVTLRRTVILRAYQRRHRHVVWMEDVAVIPRAAVPHLVRDFVSSLAV